MHESCCTPFLLTGGQCRNMHALTITAQCHGHAAMRRINRSPSRGDSARRQPSRSPDVTAAATLSPSLLLVYTPR